jgi:large subunit ribosomal protein L32e
MAIKRIKKKGHPTFNVPNFGTKSRSRVPERWRKQRGIDNKKREKMDFMGAEPTIGYRNPESIRGMRINGKRLVLVHNVDELKTVLEGDISAIDVTIAGGVSTRKRIAITEAAKGKINITNGVYK